MITACEVDADLLDEYRTAKYERAEAREALDESPDCPEARAAFELADRLFREARAAMRAAMGA